MTASVARTSDPVSRSQTWDNLKVAIAATSGFNRWQSEHPMGDRLLENTLDYQVRRYLRETLETLAY